MVVSSLGALSPRDSPRRWKMSSWCTATSHGVASWEAKKLRAALKTHRMQEREGKSSPTVREAVLAALGAGKEQEYTEAWLAGSAADAERSTSLHLATAMGTWVTQLQKTLLGLTVLLQTGCILPLHPYSFSCSIKHTYPSVWAGRHEFEFGVQTGQMGKRAPQDTNGFSGRVFACPSASLGISAALTAGGGAVGGGHPSWLEVKGPAGLLLMDTLWRN